MFCPDVVEGKWLADARLEDGSFACVVTKQLVDELQWTQAIGL